MFSARVNNLSGPVIHDAVLRRRILEETRGLTLIDSSALRKKHDLNECQKEIEHIKILPHEIPLKPRNETGFFSEY